MDKERREKIAEIIERSIKGTESIAPKFKGMINVGAERALLSVLINFPERFHEIKSTFTSEHFNDSMLRRMFEIIMWISDNRCNGGFVTLNQIYYEEQFRDELKDKSNFLNALKEFTYNEDAFKSIKNIILSSDAKKKKFAIECETLGKILEYDGNSIEDILMIGADNHFKLMESNFKNADTVSKVGDGLRERLRERIKNPSEVAGIPLLKYPHLSKILNGLKPENLSIGFARPKRGKSTLQWNLVADLGIHQGIPVGCVDSEMTQTEQEDRLVGALSSVEVRKIETGLFSKNKEDTNAVKSALDLIENGKIYLRRVPLFDTKSIITSFRLIHAMYGIKVGFFDQIKDTTDPVTPGAEQEYQRLGWLTFALKSLAEELKIHIHANMQLGRGGIDKEIASGNVDPCTLIYGSDRVLQLSNVGYIIRAKTPEEILRDGNIIQGGNTIVNVIYNRGGESHPWTGGINYLHRKNFTRFEEIGPINATD